MSAGVATVLIAMLISAAIAGLFALAALVLRGWLIAPDVWGDE